MSTVKILLLLLLLGFSAPPQSEGLSMACSDNYLEESYTYISCYLDNSTSTVSWTLSLSSGQDTRLGTCIDVNNCTSPSSAYSVYRSGSLNSYSPLRMRRDMNGSMLVCSEHHTNGSVVTANCTLKLVAVRFSSCPARGVEYNENSYPSFSCQVSISTSPLIWSLVTSSGYTRHLATCYAAYNNCTSSLSPEISANGYSYSTLNIRNISRDTGGTLQCSVGNSTASCTLDVQNPAEVERCSVQVVRGNWSALGSCDVSMTYSTFGRYEFAIYELWKRSQPSQTSSWSVFEGRQSFTPTLYINSTTRKVFYRGTYAYSWQLPDMKGQYYHQMNSWPGQRSTYVYDSFVVERPTSPSVYCDDVLREAGRVPCVCNTSSMGSPAGRLIWFTGDTVLAIGEYGVISLQFPSDVTVDSCDGLQITCQLDWIIRYNTSITLPVICEVKDAGTTSSDRLWGVNVGVGAGAGVVLALAVVVIVFLLVVLYRRGQLLCCRSVPGGEDAVAVRSQPQLYQEDGPHIYSGLIMQPAGRRWKSRDAAKSKSTPVADPEHAYENTGMDSPI